METGVIGVHPRNRGLMIGIRIVSQLDAAVVSGRVCDEDLKVWAMFYNPLRFTQQGAVDAFLSRLDLETRGRIMAVNPTSNWINQPPHQTVAP